VIGSGDVKCAAAIGVVKARADAGIGIDRVVGCSGGSLFAALLALGVDADRMTEMTTRIWTREVTSKRNTMGFLRLLEPDSGQMHYLNAGHDAPFIQQAPGDALQRLDITGLALRGSDGDDATGCQATPLH
jgi:predicted acylesterase/phospholipase RssA